MKSIESSKKSSSEIGTRVTRRTFLATSALAASGVMIVPRHVLGGVGFRAPSDRLNIAGIGVGGRGRGILQRASGWQESGETLENIVALADVDDAQAAETFAQYPKARRYKDFRVMLDEMGSSIDAVMIATPDHVHAVAAMAAMQEGKHVYRLHGVQQFEELLERGKANVVDPGRAPIV